MNKKIIGIVIGLTLVLSVIIVVLKTKGVDPVKGVKSMVSPTIELESPAKFLPSNTIMLYSISDLKGIWNDVANSNFWKEILNLRVLSDFGIKENLNKVLALLEFHQFHLFSLELE